VLFIDTWQRATSHASQNDDKEMQRAFHMAEALARHLNGCAVIAFHPPKGRVDTINGSMVIENATTCILEITGGREEKKIEVARIKGPGEGKLFKFRIEQIQLEKFDMGGRRLTGVVPDFGGVAGMDPMQREIEESNRREILRSSLARLVRAEIEENDRKPLSISAVMKRAQEKGWQLGGTAFPSRDEARKLLTGLFVSAYLFEDEWTLSLVTRHSQLKEFCLSPSNAAEVVW
jgi:hypothetical protein